MIRSVGDLPPLSRDPDPTVRLGRLEGAVDEWLAALTPTLGLFHRRPITTSEIDASVMSGGVLRALENGRYWLAGESVGPADVVGSITGRTLLVEEFAAWHFDFRGQGLPLQVAAELAPHVGVALDDSLAPVLAPIEPNSLATYFPNLRLAPPPRSTSPVGTPTLAGRRLVQRAVRRAIAEAVDHYGPGEQYDKATAVDTRAVAERTIAIAEGLPEPPESIYRERWEAGVCGFSPADRREIQSLGDMLGLTIANEPHHDRYDHLIILGGGGKTPLFRAEYARHLLAEYRITVDHVWLLGSARPLKQAELGSLEGWAERARDEFDLVTAAGTFHFPPADPDDVEFADAPADRRNEEWEAEQRAQGASDDLVASTDPGFTWLRTKRWTHNGTTVTSISAPTGMPGVRTSTADTYEALAPLAHETAPNGRALVVTTSIFVPFQRFEAFRRLYVPYDMEVDVVGYGDDVEDRPHTAENVLQEVLSAIRSARRSLVSARRLLS